MRSYLATEKSQQMPLLQKEAVQGIDFWLDHGKVHLQHMLSLSILLSHDEIMLRHAGNLKEVLLNCAKTLRGEKICGVLCTHMQKT